MNPHIKRIAIQIEEIAAKQNMHVALTGGQLYKSGVRKDIDFVLYHATSKDGKNPTNRDMVIMGLIVEGFTLVSRHGRVDKFTYEGDDIDILYPEFTGTGEYDSPAIESSPNISVTPIPAPISFL